MKKLEEVVELSGACFWNIERAEIEVGGYREPRIDLIGRREIDEKRKLIIYRIINASPILTAVMNPTSVDYGNLAARKRLTDMNNTLIKLESPYRILGQFHPHIHAKKREVIPEPAEKEVQGTLEEMKELKLRYYFIELIGEIKRRKYRKPKEVNFELQRKGLGAKILFNYSPKEGIDMYIRAFKIVKRKDRKTNKPKAHVEKELKVDLIQPTIKSRKALIKD